MIWIALILGLGLVYWQTRTLVDRLEVLIAAVHAQTAQFADRLPEKTHLVTVSDVLKTGEGRALLRARLQERLEKKEQAG